MLVDLKLKSLFSLFIFESAIALAPFAAAMITAGMVKPL